MSRYTKSAGRRKYPGHRQRKLIKRLKAAPAPPMKHYEAGETIKESELVYVASRINGVVPNADAGSAQSEKAEGGRKLVYAASRIDGKVTVSISPEILKKTEGMHWHQRCAKIAAITGRPFTEINEELYGSKSN